MHYHPIHLAMNMMGLVSIGSVIVQVFGASAFLVTWVGAAVCSSWGSLLWERNRERILGRKGANNASSTHLRGHVESRSIGASGSILGLIAIATCLAPRATVRIFPVPVGISLWAYTVALTGLSGAALINGWLPWIGHAGHLGGMVFGLVFYQYPLKRLLRIPRF